MRAELSTLSGCRTERACLEFWRGTIAEASLILLLMLLCAAVCGKGSYTAEDKLKKRKEYTELTEQKRKHSCS